MKAYNITIHDQDAKILEPILKRLSVDFTKRTIKEVDDPEVIELQKTWKNNDVLTVSETKTALKKLGMTYDIPTYKKSNQTNRITR